MSCREGHLLWAGAAALAAGGLSAQLTSASVGCLNDGPPPSLLSGHAGEPVQTRNAAPTSQARGLARRLFLLCGVKVGGAVLGSWGYDEREEASAGKTQSIGEGGERTSRNPAALIGAGDEIIRPTWRQRGGALEKKPARRRIQNETHVAKHELRARRAGGSLWCQQVVQAVERRFRRLQAGNGLSGPLCVICTTGRVTTATTQGPPELQGCEPWNNPLPCPCPSPSPLRVSVEQDTGP